MADPVRQAHAEGIRPDPDLLVSEWADAHRLLPQKSSAEPGPWRTARTPYLREPMDCLSARSDVSEIVLMFGAQLGKSEVMLNGLGYVIDHSPGPVMLVQPTVELAKRFSRQRVDPLVQDTPRLAGRVAAVRTRDSRSSLLSKEFMGGLLVITGANSAAGLRSMPARYLYADEIDAYPVDVDDEGSPLELAEARQNSFSRRKRCKASTPTLAGLSAIEAAYFASDQRRYYVPCPHCSTMQRLDWERLTWTKLGLAPRAAVYLCLECERPIENHHKATMLAAGEWRPEAESSDPLVRGYHLSGLYSPVGWLSWGEIASKFVKVRKHPTKHRTFVNTVLAETWKEQGEAPEWERLYKRRESYAMQTVPQGGLFLTAGVDVQKDRLVVELVAWGRGKESWSVDYGVLPGDTSDLVKGPWPALEAFLARTFVHESGAELSIRMLAVDSGYNTQTVYTWARKWPLNRVIAVKGQASGALVGTPSTVDITLRGKRPVYGYKVWPVSGGVAKSELYGFLGLEEPKADPTTGEVPLVLPPGWCHFPEYDEDYFRQLTAEHLVTHKTRSGFIVLNWELMAGRENHVLDCRVYARAAAAVVGIDRFAESDWLQLEAALAPVEPGPEAPPAARERWLRRRQR